MIFKFSDRQILRLWASPLVWTGVLFIFLAAKQDSCRRKIPSETIVPATDVRSSEFLTSKLKQSKTEELKSLAAHAKVYFESDGMTVEASANVIWIRDSAVWMNIKKFGLEAARVLVTRDSFFIINRLDKTYQIGEISALQREYSLPDGFQFLQNFILASAWLDPDLILRSDIKDNLHRLSGSNERLSGDYRLEEGTFVLRREIFVQKRDSRILSLQFSGFEKLKGAGIFPYIRHIEAFSAETGTLKLDLELSDIKTDVPKSYRFDIPDHYQLTE